MLFVLSFSFGQNEKMIQKKKYKVFTVNEQKQKTTSMQLGDVKIEKKFVPGKRVLLNNHRSSSKGVIFSEDFSGGALPTGWQNVDNGISGNVWEFNNPGGRTINTTTNANGFAIFDSDNWGGGAEDCDLITSAFDCSANTSVSLSFEHYFNSGYSAVAEVFVSGDNGTSWTSLEAWSASSTANAALAEYDISSVAAGQSQVMIKWNWQGDYSWYWAIDDIVVSFPPPDDAGISSIDDPSGTFTAATKDVKVTLYNFGSATLTDVNIEWEVNAVGQTLYDWTGSLTTGQTEQVTLGSYDFSAGGDFNIKANTNLPNDVADVVNDNDTAEVDVFGLQPGQLSEDFEGNWLPDGWLTIDDGDPNSWAKDNFKNHTTDGEYSVIIYYNAAAHDDWLIAPQLAPTAGNYTFSFWALRSWSEEFNVMLSTTGTNKTDFTVTIASNESPVSADTWEEFSYDLSAYNGTDIYVAIQAISTDQNYLCIDDVLGPVKAGISNNDLAVESIIYPTDYVFEGDAVTIKAVIKNVGLNSQTANQFELDVNGVSTGLTDNIGTILYDEIDTLEFIWTSTGNGVMPFKVYQTVVDDNADNDTLSNDNLVLPVGMYTADFEIPYPRWNLDDGWIGNSVPPNPESFAAYNGTTSLMCDNDGIGDPYQDRKLISPRFVLDGTYQELYFYGKRVNTLGDDTTSIQMKYSANPDGPWTNVGDSIYLTFDWELYIVDLSGITNGEYYFAFSASSTFDYLTYVGYALIDHVAGPAIPQYNVSVNKITENNTTLPAGNTAEYFIEITNLGSENDVFDLTVTEQEAGWTYEIKDKDDVGIIPDISINAGEKDTCLVKVTSPAGLTEITVDDVNFIAISQNLGTVKDTAIISTSSYPPFTVLNENFDASSEMPEYWSTINITSSSAFIEVQTNATYANSEPNSIHLDSEGDATPEQYFISPAMEGKGTAHRLIFYGRNNDPSDTLFIGTMTDPNDEGTFVHIDTVIVTGTYAEYIVNFTVPGTTYFIAISPKYEGTWDDYYLDDILFYEMVPYNVIVNKLTENATVLADDSTYYQMEIKNLGTSNETFDLSISGGAWTYEICSKVDSLVITDIFVNAESVDTCLVKVIVPAPGVVSGGETDNIQFIAVSQNDPAAKDSVEIITTADAPICTFPWSEDFATYLPLSWTEAEGILAEPSTITGTTSAWLEDGFANVGTTGSAGINIYGTFRDEWLFTPQIYLGDGSVDYQLVFDLALTEYNNTNPATLGDDDKFAVVISTDGGTTWNASQTLQLWTSATPISNTGDRISIDLTGYTGTVQIGFYGESTVSNEDNDLFVDNVEIYERVALEATTLSPDNAETGVALDAIVTALFNRDIIEVNFSQITISGQVSPTTIITGGNTLQMTPAAIFTNGTNYTVTIPAGTVEDIDDITNEDIIWTFTSLLNPPADQTLTPLDVATGIALDATVSVYFDMDVSIVDVGSVSITGATEGAVGSIVATLEADNRTLTIAHNAFANFEEVYTVVIPADAVQNGDLIGNAEITWSFTTLVAGQPTPVTYIPDVNETGVALDAAVSILFSEDLTVNNLSGITIKDASLVEVTNVVAAFNSPRTIDIAHDNFVNGEVYTVNIPADAVENTSTGVGNADVSWSFTSLMAAPAADVLVPADASTGAALNATVSITFDQDITDVNIAGITISGAIEGAIGGVSAVIEADGKTVTISHNDFTINEDVYTVTVPADAVQNADLVGNGLIAWSFTSVMAAPAVATYVPAIDAIDILPDAVVSVEFDQDVTIVDVGSITIIGATEGVVGGIVATLEVDNRTLTIAHDAFANYNEVYTVTIPSNAVQNSDNVGNGVITWSFTTTNAYQVNFHVEDAEGFSIQDATVSLTGYGSFNTNLGGNTAFVDVIPEVDIPFTVDMAGYEQATGNVTVVDANVDVPDVVMTLITYTVTFTVDDGTDPIVGATVALTGYTDQITNAVGVATFTEVAPEVDIAYTVNATDYDEETGTVTVVDADVAEPVSMTLSTYTVTFTVDDGTDPIVGATVALTGYTNQTTNASGIATFTDVLPEADIAYTVNATNYDEETGTVTVVDADVPVPVSMTLTTYTVTFTVDDGTDVIEGALVALTGYSTQTTNALGVATFTNVAPGTDIAYTVNATGFIEGTGTVTVVDADVDEAVTLVLDVVTYTVTFTVDDGTDVIEGALVALTGYSTQTTNASGVATFTNVAPATDIVYTVNATGYDEETGTVTVVDANIDEAVSMTLTTYTVTFTVNDGTDPIEGATVALTGYTDQTTSATGVATFTGVLPATDIAYTVNATGYDEETGTVTVVDADVDVPTISMTLTTYTVTFTVGDGTNVIEGAAVALTGYSNQTTNASGIATFIEVLPETDIVYTVNATGYVEVTDSLSVVDTAVDESVTLELEAVTYTVTFNVDMNDAENFTPGTDIVYITGSIVGWAEPGSNADYIMTDVDADGIYTIALSMEAGDYAYKYFMNAGWDGGEWNGDPNRTFTVSNDMVINDVWSIYETYTVTFTVNDEAAAAIEGAVVTLTGYGEQTTDVSGVATFTYVAIEADIVYTVNATGYVGITDSLSVVDADVAEAVTLILEPATYTVTFNVDMNDAENFTAGTDTVYITGSMAGWAEPGSNEDYIMTDVDADGIYTIELTMEAGDYEYKYFMNAGWTGGEWDGGDNRAFTVSNDMVINNVWGVFESYPVTFIVVDKDAAVIEGAVITLTGYGEQTTDATGTAVFDSVSNANNIAYTVVAEGYVTVENTVNVNAAVTVDIVMSLEGIDELTTNGFNIYPNPSDGMFNIKSERTLDNAQLFIRDINGKLILSEILNSDINKIDISNSPAGIYLLQIITDNKIINHKILLK